MSQTDQDTLHLIYEYQLAVSGGGNGQEYVVRGAQVYCGFGSTSCVMNLPQSHGLETRDGRPLILTTDHTIDNIKGFGTCKISKTKCIPQLEEWEFSNNNMKVTLGGKILKTVTVNTTAKCLINTNGTELTPYVAFESSGQVVADYKNDKDGAVEIIEDQKASWTRDTNNTDDFSGHIKPEHSGIYNLKIYTDSPSNGGTIFLYHKTKLIGSYNLEKISDTLTTNLVLDKGTDYYIEVDCPNLNNFSYLLCGNQEINHLENTSNSEQAKMMVLNYYAAIWLLDSSFQKYHEDTFLKNRNENTNGVMTAIFYLDSDYRDLLKDVLEHNEYMAKSKQISASLIGNALSAVSLLLTLVGKLSAVGTTLSAIALFASVLPESEISKLINKLIEYELKNVVLYFSDNSRTRTESTIASTTNPLGSAVHQNYFYEISLFDGFPNSGITAVLGKKYLKGNMEYYHGIINRDEAFKEVAGVLSAIEDSLKGNK